VWKDCVSLSLDDRLAFALKRDNSNKLNFKGIGDAFIHCLSFFYYFAKEPMGISGIRQVFPAGNTCPQGSGP